MEVISLISNILVLIIAILIGLFVKSYFPSYFKEKAKNLATKEDFKQILEQSKIITETNENIKIILLQKDIISRQKWELKKTAYENIIEGLAEFQTSLALLPTKLEDALEYISDNMVIKTDNELKENNREEILNKLRSDLSKGNLKRNLGVQLFENPLFKDAYDSYFNSLVRLNKANAISKIYINEMCAQNIESLLSEMDTFFKDNLNHISEEHITLSLDKINDIIHSVAKQAKQDLEEHFNKNV